MTSVIGRGVPPCTNPPRARCGGAETPLCEQHQNEWAEDVRKRMFPAIPRLYCVPLQPGDKQCWWQSGLWSHAPGGPPRKSPAELRADVMRLFGGTS